jgi:Fur family transcriptional regulator, peroxide stress response regulator
MKKMENVKVYCKEKLKNYGFRITPQRIKIFSCLVESDSHPTAEMLYQEVRKYFPNISFDTVNRTLLCLADKGLIKIVEAGYGARRFDANLKKHYYFRCLKCKKIIDFESPEYDKIKIPEDVQKKFKIYNQKIILEGICPDCLKKQAIKNSGFSEKDKLNKK